MLMEVMFCDMVSSKDAVTITIYDNAELVYTSKYIYGISIGFGYGLPSLKDIIIDLQCDYNIEQITYSGYDEFTGESFSQAKLAQIIA